MIYAMSDIHGCIGELQKNMEQMPEHLMHLPLREIPAAYVEGAPLLFDFVEILDNIDNPEFKKKIHNPLDFSNMDDAALEALEDNGFAVGINYFF